MNRIEKAAPNKASRGLLTYIRNKYGSIPAFCEKNPSLDRIKVQKAIAGKIKRIDVEFAANVEDATEGAIEWRWWIVLAKKGRQDQ